ncbi:MAG: glycoside hydrolase family 2 protein, partial [Bryobacteraceae bacterium]
MQSSRHVRQRGAVLSRPGFTPSGWYRVRVPTTVLAALVANGVYPDPYFGLELKKIPGFKEGRWLVMPEDSPFRPSWWFRTEFALPPSWRGKHLRLHLHGINYQANVWVNGRQIADAGQVIGMFRRFEFPLDGHATFDGRNGLAIEVIPPGLLPNRTYGTKQIQATTGWDDHNPQPPDMNMGLWRDVSITASGPVILRHPYVPARLELPSLASVELAVSVEVTNLEAREVNADIRGEVEQIRFAQALRLAPGETRLVRFTADRFPQLRIRRPRVWWPHPLGPQELYLLRLSAWVAGQLSDAVEVRFGIRNAGTYLNEEGWRQYTINGRKILIRGAAWMTCDMLLRLDRRRYEALIRYAREANLNMLCSEGFSIRETDEFYDLCDRYGVMVTQQLFGRSIPDEALAVACVKDTILRIATIPASCTSWGMTKRSPRPRSTRPIARSSPSTRPSAPTSPIPAHSTSRN